MSSNHGSTSADVRTLILFALVSAAAVALGSLGLALHGAPFGSWVRNPAAYAAGAVLSACLLAVGRSRRFTAAVVILAVVGLAATLFAEDQSGVRRWIDVGPLHVNIAALLLPMAIVALARIGASSPMLFTALAAIGALLVAQPDASQATAFAVGAALLLWQRRDLPPASMLGAALGLAALTISAWLRPDPLQPVPEAEGIFALLAGVSMSLAAAAALALIAASLLPLRRPRARDGGMPSGSLPLAGYFLTTACMPLFGAYPVPLVGLGMSFPVGYWLGMALLCVGVPDKVRR